MGGLRATAVLALGLFATGDVLAETPVPGGGLPPLPQPQGRDAEIERLERESDALKREARELGGGRSIQDALRNVRNAFYEGLHEAGRLEELAQEMGYTLDEMRAKQREIARSEGLEIIEFTVKQGADEAVKQAIQRGISALLGKAFGLYSAADTVVDIVKRVERWRLKMELAGNFGDNARSVQANWTALNQMLIALYGALGLEAQKFRRLEEIARRDRQIFQRIVQLRPSAVGGAVLDRERDSAYDDLLFEIERLRFERRIADIQGNARESRRLGAEIDRLERQVRQMEDAGAGIGPDLRQDAAARTGAMLSDAGADEADGYVRVCDAYGAGFFYIPGTETCLRIGGGVRYSPIETPSQPGAGTAVRGGVESFVFSPSVWISRYGGSFDWQMGLGKNAFGSTSLGAYYGYHFGEASFATGQQTYSGRSEVGVGGVTTVGLTFGRPNGGATGVGTSTAGFGVTGAGDIGSAWGRGLFGVGKLFGDDDAPLRFGVRAGGYLEHLGYWGQGRADVTFGGAPFAGFYQTYDHRSGDTWVGAVIGADIHYRITPRTTISVGADLLPAYHWGHADIGIQTGTGGGAVFSEAYSYDHSGLTVGVSLRAGVEFGLADNWTAAIGYQWSMLPGVTGVNKPAGPAFQPLDFVSRAVSRHDVTVHFRYAF